MRLHETATFLWFISSNITLSSHIIPTHITVGLSDAQQGKHRYPDLKSHTCILLHCLPQLFLMILSSCKPTVRRDSLPFIGSTRPMPELVANYALYLFKIPTLIAANPMRHTHSSSLFRNTRY
ncbi:hypothetical protein BT63DRAFT_421531 [Microthyrium microscopicum]|uniref:Uncharacterized protein n=1 Tax=Microthyrium microscopicum TaxID=703497 RepID=A0A6A6UNT5_9PEZI|nr:hypothetical protein BT63DRAFT_421531 [Microthyrium microscopicum]